MIDTHEAKRQLRPTAVICADTQVLHRTLSGLHRFGIEARGLRHWSDLGCAAKNGEVIVIFTDRFDDAQVLSELRSLEHRKAGPALIAVTDRAPPIWFPTLTRELPAIVIDQRSSPGKLLEALATCSAAIDEKDDAEPELPFTD
jgi:hypothetical protein